MRDGVFAFDSTGPNFVLFDRLDSEHLDVLVSGDSIWCDTEKECGNLDGMAVPIDVCFIAVNVGRS